jgi:hypothetical protein
MLSLSVIFSSCFCKVSMITNARIKSRWLSSRRSSRLVLTESFSLWVLTSARRVKAKAQIETVWTMTIRRTFIQIFPCFSMASWTWLSSSVLMPTSRLRPLARAD